MEQYQVTGMSCAACSARVDMDDPCPISFAVGGQEVLHKGIRSARPPWQFLPEFSGPVLFFFDSSCWNSFRNPKRRFPAAVLAGINVKTFVAMVFGH